MRIWDKEAWPDTLSMEKKGGDDKQLGDMKGGNSRTGTHSSTLVLQALICLSDYHALRTGTKNTL